MKWVDLTDILVCRLQGYLFYIRRPEYRNDIIEWGCLDPEKNILQEGKTVKMTVAKKQCRDLYRQLKQK